MFRKLNLPLRFFLSYLIIIVLVLGAVGLTLFVMQNRMTTLITDESIKDMASVVKDEPGVRQAFLDGKVSGDTMLFLDKMVRSEDSIDYIVLARPDGTRIYHPDHSLIGEKFVGGDETKAVAGEKDYIVDGKGTSADQRRYFSSIKGEDGSVLGFIMVSRRSADIAKIKQRNTLHIFLIFLVSVIAAALIAYIVGNRIRRQLLGYEPYQLARLFTQREGILDELEEGLLLVSETGTCEYANRSAESLLRSGGTDRTTEFINTHVMPLYSLENITANRTVRLGDITLIMDILPVEDKKRFIGNLVILRDKTEATKLAAQLTGIDQIIGALRASTHETKNKMHVILGLLQLDETQKAIEYIQASAENDSEADTIRRTVRNNTLAALLIGKRSRARELGIDLTVRKDSFIDEHSRLLSSADLVTIIGNLIENSFDALSGVDDRPREISLFVNENAQGLNIQISDTGCGMNGEIIEKISKESFTTKGEGHGIGTTLIRNILSGYDADMYIESEPDEGTTINIIIRGEQDENDQSHDN